MRQILEAETPVVTIVGKTWLLHVTEVLRAKPDENLAMIGDTVRFLKDHGKTVIYDAEHCFDGFKDEPEYALATWQAAEKAGADCVVLCDTNGGCLPEEIARITGARQGQAELRASASTRTTIAAWAWPMRWPASKPAPRRCRAPSTATANARATAI